MRGSQSICFSSICHTNGVTQTSDHFEWWVEGIDQFDSFLCEKVHENYSISHPISASVCNEDKTGAGLVFLVLVCPQIVCNGAKKKTLNLRSQLIYLCKPTEFIQLEHAYQLVFMFLKYDNFYSNIKDNTVPPGYEVKIEMWKQRLANI